ncbi:hypothetical protein QYF61_016960 [Mycteria americana]|uniref:Uncharacterized protein n=1 Tax=Mycteria americana TaxID=33587 RepID=A0AAN7MZ94_MYCAM|nr:hypothetical protein QYF61_016960 [Mycteria americana]
MVPSVMRAEAEQPQFPQPLPIRLVLQTLPQLRCPSLDTLQPLNVSLVVRGPKLNTVFEPLPITLWLLLKKLIKSSRPSVPIWDQFKPFAGDNNQMDCGLLVETKYCARGPFEGCFAMSNNSDFFRSFTIPTAFYERGESDVLGRRGASEESH